MQAAMIPVSDTTPAKQPSECINLERSVSQLLQRKVEAMAVSHDRLVVCKDVHAFAQAAHDAFYDHFPLVISPDDIWFCIAQGFAHHVNLNRETLRHHFVVHEGKLKLSVFHAEIELGQPSPWEEAFAAFSDQIAKHVGQSLRDTVVADFSTTTRIHKAATEVALMDTFQGYFDYELRFGCGIPSVQLTGAPDDWRNIRRRASTLAKYGLETWITALQPILDELDATSRGYADREFWQSFFRHKSRSGRSAMTGWINVLFPFLKDGQRFVPNPFIATWQKEVRSTLGTQLGEDWRERDIFHGPHLSQIPSGISSAPVKMKNVTTGKEFEMRFVAGLFGVAQDATSLALSTWFGWAVTYDTVIPPEVKAGHLSEMMPSRGPS